MNDKLLAEHARRARRNVHKIDPRFEDWAIFSKSLGFFQWKRKNQLTPAQVEIYQKAWNEST